LTRYTSPGSGGVPSLSLATCEVLEQAFITVVGDTSFPSIASTISSVNSFHFQKLILELQTTAHRNTDLGQIDLVDGLNLLDAPLTRIARAASEKKREVSLILLGQDPEFLSLGFMDFQLLGSVLAGEKIGEDDYFWSFSAPKSKGRRINILDRLLRRKNLD
jgi:hypothetical protein